MFSRALLNREHGLRAGRRELLAHMELQGECMGSVLCNSTPGQAATVPICAQFSQEQQGAKLLALAGHEGFITIVDVTSARTIPEHLLGDGNDRRPIRHWQAHSNMLHDLQWGKGDTRIYTGSADMTVVAWDVASMQRIATCVGHNAGVKSISVHEKGDVVASGSKDGSVMLWDMRTPGRKEAVWHVEAAHASEAPSTGKRGRKGPPPAPVHVSSVVFLPGSTALATASAGPRDSVVKYWDLRRASEPLHLFSPHQPASANLSGAATPRSVRAASGPVLTPGTGGRGTPRTPRNAAAGRGGVGQDEVGSFHALGQKDGRHGVLSLAVAPQGHQLLVSCVDGSFRLFDISNPHLGPRSTFHLPKSDAPVWSLAHRWFIRTAFSPDGDYFLSGAVDNNAYIYEVARPDKDPICLAGHEGTVGGVAWSKVDPMQVSTCSDDCTVRVWGLQLCRPARPDVEVDASDGVEADVNRPVAARPSQPSALPSAAGDAVIAAAAAAAAAAGQREASPDPGPEDMFTPPARMRPQQLGHWHVSSTAEAPAPNSTPAPSAQHDAADIAGASDCAPSGSAAAAAAAGAAGVTPAPAGCSARDAAAAAAIARFSASRPNPPSALGGEPSTSAAGAGASGASGFVTPASAARPPRVPRNMRGGASSHVRSRASWLASGPMDLPGADGMPEGGGESPGAAAVASVLKLLSPDLRPSTEVAGTTAGPAESVQQEEEEEAGHCSQPGPSCSGAAAMEVDSPARHASASPEHQAPWYLAGNTATGGSPGDALAAELPPSLGRPPRLRMTMRRPGAHAACVGTGGDEAGDGAASGGDSPVAPSSLAIALAGASEIGTAHGPAQHSARAVATGAGVSAAGARAAVQGAPNPDPSPPSDEDIDFDAEFDNKENVPPPAGNLPPRGPRRLTASPPSARATPAAGAVTARSPRSGEVRSPRSAESRSPRAALDGWRSPRAMDALLRSPRALDVRSPRAAEAAARRLSGGSSLGSGFGPSGSAFGLSGSQPQASGSSSGLIRPSPSTTSLLGQAGRPLAPIPGYRPLLTAAAVPVAMQTIPASPLAGLGLPGLSPLRAPPPSAGATAGLVGAGPFGLAASPRTMEFLLLPPSPRVQHPRPTASQQVQLPQVQPQEPVVQTRSQASQGQVSQASQQQGQLSQGQGADEAIEGRASQPSSSHATPAEGALVPSQESLGLDVAVQGGQGMQAVQFGLGWGHAQRQQASQEGGTRAPAFAIDAATTIPGLLLTGNMGRNVAVFRGSNVSAPDTEPLTSQPFASQPQQQPAMHPAAGLTRLGSTAASPPPKAGGGPNGSSSPAAATTTAATDTGAGAAGTSAEAGAPTAIEPSPHPAAGSTAQHLEHLTHLLQSPGGAGTSFPFSSSPPHSSPPGDASGAMPPGLHRPQALAALAPGPSSSPTRRALPVGTGWGVGGSKAVGSPASSPGFARASLAHAWRQQTVTPSLVQPGAAAAATAAAAAATVVVECAGLGLGCATWGLPDAAPSQLQQQPCTAAAAVAEDVEMADGRATPSSPHALHQPFTQLACPTLPGPNPNPSTQSPQRTQAVLNPFAAAQRPMSPCAATSLPHATMTPSTAGAADSAGQGSPGDHSQVVPPGRLLPGGGTLRLLPSNPLPSIPFGEPAGSAGLAAPRASAAPAGQPTAPQQETSPPAATAEAAQAAEPEAEAPAGPAAGPVAGTKHAADGEAQAGQIAKRPRTTSLGAQLAGMGWGLSSGTCAGLSSASQQQPSDAAPGAKGLNKGPCNPGTTGITRFFPTTSSAPPTASPHQLYGPPLMPGLPPPPQLAPSRAGPGPDLNHLPCLSPGPPLILGHVALHHADSAPLVGPHSFLMSRPSLHHHHSTPAPSPQLTPPRAAGTARFIPPTNFTTKLGAENSGYVPPSRPSGAQQQGPHDQTLMTPPPPPSRCGLGGPARQGNNAAGGAAGAAAGGPRGEAGGMWGSPVQATPREQLVACTPATGPSPFSCFATASEGSFRAPTGSGRGSGRSTAGGRRSSPFPSILLTASKNAAPSPSILLASASGGSVGGPLRTHHHHHHHHHSGGAGGAQSLLNPTTATSTAPGSGAPQGQVVPPLTIHIAGHISLPQMLPPKFPAPSPAGGAGAAAGMRGTGGTPGSGSAAQQPPCHNTNGAAGTSGAQAPLDGGSNPGGAAGRAGSAAGTTAGGRRGGAPTLHRSRSHALLTALTLDTGTQGGGSGGITTGGKGQQAGRPSPMGGYAGLGLASSRLPPVDEDEDEPSDDMEEDGAEEEEEALGSCSETSEGAASAGGLPNAAAGAPVPGQRGKSGVKEVESAHSPGMLSPAGASACKGRGHGAGPAAGSRAWPSTVPSVQGTGAAAAAGCDGGVGPPGAVAVPVDSAVLAAEGPAATCAAAGPESMEV